VPATDTQVPEGMRDLIGPGLQLRKTHLLAAITHHKRGVF
jgi:hypothetical protein